MDGRDRTCASGGAWVRMISEIEGTALLGRSPTDAVLRGVAYDIAASCEGIGIGDGMGMIVELEGVLDVVGRTRRRRGRAVVGGG